MSGSANIVEDLAREIGRVTELRAEYEALDGTPGVNVRPVMMMIDRSLEAAKVAAGSGDIVTIGAALRDLREYAA